MSKLAAVPQHLRLGQAWLSGAWYGAVVLTVATHAGDRIFGLGGNPRDVHTA